MAEALLQSLPPDAESHQHCKAYVLEIAEARKELDARRQRALLAVACALGDAEAGDNAPPPGEGQATRALEVALAAEAASPSLEPVDEALRVAAARMLRARRAALAGEAAAPPPDAGAPSSLLPVFTAADAPETLDAAAVAATNGHVRAVLGANLGAIAPARAEAAPPA